MTGGKGKALLLMIMHSRKGVIVLVDMLVQSVCVCMPTTVNLVYIP